MLCNLLCPVRVECWIYGKRPLGCRRILVCRCVRISLVAWNGVVLPKALRFLDRGLCLPWLLPIPRWFFSWVVVWLPLFGWCSDIVLVIGHHLLFLLPHLGWFVEILLLFLHTVVVFPFCWVFFLVSWRRLVPWKILIVLLVGLLLLLVPFLVGIVVRLRLPKMWVLLLSPFWFLSEYLEGLIGCRFSFSW